MAKFCIGVSSKLNKADGSPAFPGYDISPLQRHDDLDVAMFDGVPELPAETLASYDAMILLGEHVFASNIPAGGRLIHIARMGVGYDTLDVPALTANDIVLTITPGAVRRPMAVATLTLLLALAGRLFDKDRITRGGPNGWARRLDMHGSGLIGRTLGLFGVGNIGAEVLRLARPLDMRFIAHDPYLDPAQAKALDVEPVSSDDIFAQSDFVSLNCPLTPETHHLVNDRTLDLMRPTAYLINTARGGIVDQAALCRALAERRIAGAGLDVLDPEPSASDEPLNSLDNVIMAPHALGWTDQLWAAMADINCAAILAVKDGQVPENVVNPEVLERPGFKDKLAAHARSS